MMQHAFFILIKSITLNKKMKENFMINDAEIASFSLNDMITGFDEDTSAYTHLPAKNPYPHFCFALNIGMTVEEVIEALKNYLSELERGECREVVSIEKKMIEKEYWTKGGMLRHNLLVVPSVVRIGGTNP
jgi:hypothetical protein